VLQFCDHFELNFTRQILTPNTHIYMQSPKTGIIILNFNGIELTCACIDSLLKIDYPNFQIYLVENGSRDHPAAFFRGKYPQIHVIESEINLGFTGGCNLGMRKALKDGVGYILLLNNDTVVAPDFLTRLIEAGEANPRSGILTPKIRYFNPDTHLWFAGGRYNLWTGISVHIGEREFDRGQYDTPGEVTFITGCSPLVKRALLEEIGLLREDLFITCEDLDWSLKARKAGWILYYVPSAVIWHKESIDTQKGLGKPFQLYLATRNLLAVHKAHARWYHNIVFYPYFSLRWLFYQAMKHALRGEFQMIVALYRAVRSFLKGEMGLPDWFRPPDVPEKG